MEEGEEEVSPIVKLAEKACPAVVTIVATEDLSKIESLHYFPFENQNYIIPGGKEGAAISSGSGFLVTPKGHVVTCTHVVKERERKYTIVVDPKHKYRAKVLSRNALTDIAILKIEGENFPYLPLGDSSKLKLGETVVAIGNPLGEFDDTLSAGIVSGLSRRITSYGGLPFRVTSLRGLIQTDAAINPGNSGGALVNIKGEVIGINTAMIMGAENISFAIPINYLKDDLAEVLKYGKVKRPFLGVRYFVLDEEAAKSNKLPVNYGAFVIREYLGEGALVKNSPAQRAGLKEYDIILKCNGEKITQDNPLSRILQKHKIGEEVNLEVLRGKKRFEVKVKLGEKK